MPVGDGLSPSSPHLWIRCYRLLVVQRMLTSAHPLWVIDQTVHHRVWLTARLEVVSWRSVVCSRSSLVCLSVLSTASSSQRRSNAAFSLASVDNLPDTQSANQLCSSPSQRAQANGSTLTFKGSLQRLFQASLGDFRKKNLRSPQTAAKFCALNHFFRQENELQIIISRRGVTQPAGTPRHFLRSGPLPSDLK